MSSDAKMWYDGISFYGSASWKGVHDGECDDQCFLHEQGQNLTTVMQQIEKRLGGEMRWEFEVDGGGKLYLRGYK